MAMALLLARGLLHSHQPLNLLLTGEDQSAAETIVAYRFLMDGHLVASAAPRNTAVPQQSSASQGELIIEASQDHQPLLTPDLVAAPAPLEGEQNTGAGSDLPQETDEQLPSKARRRMDTGSDIRVYWQYAPADHPWIVHRFLEHWQPDLLLWVASPVRPSLISKTAARQVPMVLVNGSIQRLSGTNQQTLQALKGKLKLTGLLRQFSAILGQNAEQTALLNHLSGRGENHGDLRFSLPRLEFTEEHKAALWYLLGDVTCWLSAFPRAAEIPAIAECHRRLKAKFRRNLTIVYPRTPREAEIFYRLLRREGLAVARRSREDIPTGLTDVYLADGEAIHDPRDIELFYSTIDTVFLGGTLISQASAIDPLTAARHGCVILCGKQTAPHSSLYSDLSAARALRQIADGPSLAAAISAYWRDSETGRQLSEAAFHFAYRTPENDHKILESISELVERAIADHSKRQAKRVEGKSESLQSGARIKSRLPNEEARKTDTLARQASKSDIPSLLAESQEPLQDKEGKPDSSAELSINPSSLPSGDHDEAGPRD